MQRITLQSHVGADGQLSLTIPTGLTNTELEIIIWLRPVDTTFLKPKSLPFSRWWAKQIADTATHATTPNEEARFDYLAKRYGL